MRSDTITMEKEIAELEARLAAVTAERDAMAAELTGERVVVSALLIDALAALEVELPNAKITARVEAMAKTICEKLEQVDFVIQFVIQDARRSRNRDAGRISRALHRLSQLRDVPWWNPWKMRRLARKAMIELCPNDPWERFEIGEAVYVEWTDPCFDWNYFRVMATNEHAIRLQGADDPDGNKHAGDTFTATWDEIADIYSVEK